MIRFSLLSFFLFLFVLPVLGQTTALSGEAIQTLVQSPDGSLYVTVLQMGGIRVIDAKTKRPIREFNNSDFQGLTLGPCRNVFFVQPDIVAVLGFTDLRLFNVKNGQRTATYSCEKGNDILVSSSQRHALKFSRGQTEIIDLKMNRLVNTVPILFHQGMDLSPDGQRLYAPVTGGVDCYEVKSGKKLSHYPISTRIGGVERVLLTSTEKTIIGLGYSYTYVWEKGALSAKKTIKGQNWNISTTFVTHDRWLVVPGPVKKEIVVEDLTGQTQQRVITPSGTSDITGVGITPLSNKILLSEVTKISEYELVSGSSEGSADALSDTYRSICMSFDESAIFMGTEDGYIKYIDIATASYRGVYWNYGKPVKYLRFEAQGREIEIGDGTTIEVFNVATRKKIRSYPDRTTFPSARIDLNRNQTMYATLFSGELTLRYKGGFLKFVTKKGDNREYFASETVTHYFEGSSAGIEDLGLFGTGTEIIAANQLKKRFFKPDLLRSFFDGTVMQFAVKDRITLFKLTSLHPTVRLFSEGNIVKVNLTDRGGGIGPVALYINRKLIAEDIRANPSSGASKELAISVNLTKYKVFDPASENRIEVQAYNGEAFVSSPLERITILPKSQPGSTPDGLRVQSSKQNQKPTLWALMVGVSKYAGPNLSLKFAAKDAEDLSKALEIGGRRLFSNRVNIIKLTTESKRDSLMPNSENIRRALNRIEDEAGRDDVVVLFFAGHGHAVPARDEFFFLTSEARDFAGQYSTRESISDSDILRVFRNTRCQKLALILDACYSGRVIDNIARRGDAYSTVRAIDKMKNQSGAYILTGAASTQAAWESSDFGQGLLTHFLLEGMRGPCLEDGVLPVFKWMEYGKNRVEKYTTERHQAAPQNAQFEVQVPGIYSSKDHIPMAIAQFPDQESISRIPISQPKAVVSPGTLQTDGLNDPLDLQVMLNKTLDSAAAYSPSFYYINSSAYPDSYKVSGVYDVDPKTKLVSLKRLKIFQGKTEKKNIELGNGRPAEKEVVMNTILKHLEAYFKPVQARAQKN